MLQITDASIKYGHAPLFSPLSFHLLPGEIGCISGPSGCGKSSLLAAVMGFVPLCRGTIHIHGTRLQPDTIDTLRRHIAWIPQELALPMEWVSEMVQLPFALRANRATPFSTRQLFEHFEQLDLTPDLYHKRVSEVSGGQRQRIMIAVTAMLRKPLWVLDEPTSALDTRSARLVMHFLLKQVGQGSAILAVSHDATFAAACKKQLILESTPYPVTPSPDN